MSKIKKLKNFYKNKKILITGHTGFVGSWFSLFRTQLNCKIYVIAKYNCNNSKNYKLLNISKAFEKEYFIDINNHINLEKKIKLVKPDVIFHLAAQAYVLEGFNDPLNTFKTNIPQKSKPILILYVFKIISNNKQKKKTKRTFST